MKVLVKKLNPNAQIPTFGKPGDGCQDVVAVSCKYNPKYDRFEYGLGFATEIPEGYYVAILPRSGNTKTDAYLPNSCGIIDADYRGEWKVIYKLRIPLFGLLEEINPMELAPYKVGDKLAQAILRRKEDCEFIQVDKLSETERGADGGLNRTDTDFTK